jgi:hypothetical protein
VLLGKSLSCSARLTYARLTYKAFWIVGADLPCNRNSSDRRHRHSTLWRWAFQHIWPAALWTSWWHPLCHPWQADHVGTIEKEPKKITIYLYIYKLFSSPAVRVESQQSQDLAPAQQDLCHIGGGLGFLLNVVSFLCLPVSSETSE